jgi:hypothetical protein
MSPYGHTKCEPCDADQAPKIVNGRLVNPQSNGTTSHRLLTLQGSTRTACESANRVGFVLTVHTSSGGFGTSLSKARIVPLPDYVYSSLARDLVMLVRTRSIVQLTNSFIQSGLFAEWLRGTPCSPRSEL